MQASIFFFRPVEGRVVWSRRKGSSSNKWEGRPAVGKVKGQNPHPFFIPAPHPAPPPTRPPISALAPEQQPSSLPTEGTPHRGRCCVFASDALYCFSPFRPPAFLPRVHFCWRCLLLSLLLRLSSSSGLFPSSPGGAREVISVPALSLSLHYSPFSSQFTHIRTCTRIHTHTRTHT